MDEQENHLLQTLLAWLVCWLVGGRATILVAAIVVPFVAQSWLIGKAEPGRTKQLV